MRHCDTGASGAAANSGPRIFTKPCRLCLYISFSQRSCTSPDAEVLWLTTSQTASIACCNASALTINFIQHVLKNKNNIYGAHKQLIYIKLKQPSGDQDQKTRENTKTGSKEPEYSPSGSYGTYCLFPVRRRGSLAVLFEQQFNFFNYLIF